MCFIEQMVVKLHHSPLAIAMMDGLMGRWEKPEKSASGGASDRPVRDYAAGRFGCFSTPTQEASDTLHFNRDFRRLLYECTHVQIVFVRDKAHSQIPNSY